MAHLWIGERAATDVEGLLSCNFNDNRAMYVHGQEWQRFLRGGATDMPLHRDPVFVIADDDILISVIVPAYNAEATLAETLASIAGQRHRTLEILIIDDGSTDGTGAIATRFCDLDSRARVLAQANGGVASARNLGLRSARGSYVAPIDADDIWHPEHLAGLLARMRQSADILGFVSAPYRLIDRGSRIVGSAPPIPLRSNAVDALIAHNFVGNGSAMLLNRGAALEVGGYDEKLRLAGVEGCEDFLLQLRIADRYPVAVVDAFTVGYRRLSTSMSSNVRQMIGSKKLALAMFFSEQQKAVPPLKRLRSGHARAMVREHAIVGRRSAAALQLLGAFALDPAGTCAALLRLRLFMAFERGDPAGLNRPLFTDVSPRATLNTPMDRARRWTSVRRWREGKSIQFACPRKGGEEAIAYVPAGTLDAGDYLREGRKA